MATRRNNSRSPWPFLIAVVLIVLFPGLAKDIAGAVGGKVGLPQVEVPSVPSPSLPSLPAVPSTGPSTVTEVDAASAANAGFKAAGLTALDAITAVESRPFRAGYDRDCSKGHACQFGPAWTDNTVAPGGKNGCDTRNDMLLKSLTNITMRGTSKCGVQSGDLADPYTGQSIHFEYGGKSEIDLDHVVPLKAVWDFGGADWTLEKRTAIANDPMNLFLAQASANRSKGDKTPAEWMPSNKAFACEYASRYAGVAAAYGLPMSTTDKDSLTLTLNGAC